jgi:hypothetical protein
MRVITVLEGMAEYYLLSTLKEKLGLRNLEIKRPEVNSKLGSGTLYARIEAALNTSEAEAVLIVCDAESEMADRVWSRIRAKLSLPEKSPLPTNGYIGRAGNGRQVGVWIMPNNRDAGMIEDLYLRAIPADDRELQLASDFVHGLERPKFAKEDPDAKRRAYSKATLTVWLGIQPEPAMPGEALRRGYIRHDAQALAPLCDWLREFAQA